MRTSSALRRAPVWMREQISRGRALKCEGLALNVGHNIAKEGEDNYLMLSSHWSGTGTLSWVSRCRCISTTPELTITIRTSVWSFVVRKRPVYDLREIHVSRMFDRRSFRFLTLFHLRESARAGWFWESKEAEWRLALFLLDLLLQFCVSDV